MKTKKRMKTIPKTLRGKKRYLVIRVQTPKPVALPVLSRSFVQLLRELYGSVGFAKQKFRSVDWNPKTGEWTVCCDLKAVGDVQAAVVLWHQIENAAVKAEVVQKSGTLKKTRS